MNFIDNFEEIDPEIHGIRLPKFELTQSDYKDLDIPRGISSLNLFQLLVERGFQKRLKNNIDKDKEQLYKERLDYEMSVIEPTDFVEYILMVWDVVNIAKKNNIAVGKGRGSAASSLVLYCLGITDIDPLKYGLFFERFLSEARTTPNIVDGVKYYSDAADVDLDIEDSLRESLVDLLKEKYKGHFCKISTFGSLQSKRCIKEVCKIVLGYSEEQSKHISALIPSIFNIAVPLSRAADEVPEFKKFVSDHPRAFQIARKLEGLICSKGSHASAYIVSYKPLTETLPCEMGEGEIVTSYDMDWAQLDNIKLDLLGLKAIGIINEVCKMLKIQREDFDINYETVFKHLQDVRYPYGLFQISGDCNLRVVNKVKPKNIDHLAAVTALARPGALQFVDSYAKYVNEGECKSVHPFFDDVLQPTAGLALYQEGTMKMCEKIGLTKADGEVIRKCVTKDTMFISKQRGWISISNLLETGYENDLFLVMDENGKQQWKKINNIWKTEKPKQVEYVRARNGMYVKATGWHQFLTADGWKAKRYLSKEDYLVCAKSIEYDGEDKISRDMAIIIAGLITEGFFVENSSSTFVNWDQEIMAIFEEAFARELGFAPSKHLEGKVVSINKEAKEKISKYLSFGVSNTKKIPDVMMGMTKETSREFLAFMFSCEATVTDCEISLTSASRQLVNQIQLLLLRFGVRSNILVKENSKYKRNYFVLDIGEHKDVKQFYKELGVFVCKPKREIIKRYANKKVKENYTTDIVPANITKKFIQQYGFVLSRGSGVHYKSNISVRNFRKFAEKSQDKKWIDFSNGHQEFVQVESLNDLYDRSADVYDFTIDDETPFIIANGIVIHNCIGKKKVKEMKKWKEVIFETAKKNGLDKEIPEILWKILEDSANYSFNASHSFSYGYTSAETVYLKHKYPQHFFLACLKIAASRSDFVEEFRAIQQELPYFNIQLLPPHIGRSKLDFEIEGDNIRFGLGEIKGVSEKSIDKLRTFISAEKSSDFQIFSAAKEAKLNIGILSALIQSGALGHDIWRRSSKVLEAQVWNVLTPKEKLFCLQNEQKYNSDLIALLKDYLNWIDSSGKKFTKLSRLETIRKKSAGYFKIYHLNNRNELFASYFYEKTLLGFSYSTTIQRIFESEIENLRNIHSIAENVPVKGAYKLVATVSEVISGKSKNGNTYLKLKVFDETGSNSAMLLGDKLARYLDKFEQPKENDIVYITGNKGDDILWINELEIQNHKVYTRLSELESEDSTQ